MALCHVKDNKIDDYQGAVPYLGKKVLIAFPPKIGDGTKKHIGSAISPCKVEKAAKVKGKGGAWARKTFNGFDWSNFTHDFTMDEWNKMGQDGRNFIKTSPEACCHKAKDTAKVCKDSKATTNKGADNSDDDTPAVNQVRSSSTKSRKAGNSFGQGAHGKNYLNP